MGVQVCPKHDVAFGDNGTCWCCDLAKKNKATQQQQQPAAGTVRRIS